MSSRKLYLSGEKTFRLELVFYLGKGMNTFGALCFFMLKEWFPKIGLYLSVFLVFIYTCMCFLFLTIRVVRPDIDFWKLWLENKFWTRIGLSWRAISLSHYFLNANGTVGEICFWIFAKSIEIKITNKSMLCQNVQFHSKCNFKSYIEHVGFKIKFWIYGRYYWLRNK